MKKKYINIFLLFNFLLVAFNLRAQLFSGGSGTSGDPYKIGNLTDLQYLSENSIQWDKNFIQTANIDATATSTWNVGDHDNNIGTPDQAMGFIPIGSSTTSFVGNYDGQGFIIDKLQINRPLEDYVGLFGNTYSGNLSRIHLSSALIIGKDYVGGLVGRFQGNVIVNSSVSGSVSGYDFIGGLIGSGDDGVISGVYSSASVSGNVNVGGFVGFSIASIENSYASGSVSGGSGVGGLVGSQGIFGTISGSYASGSVGGVVYTGGLVGYNDGNVLNSFHKGPDDSSGSGGTLISEILMQIQSTFTGYDFGSIWKMDGGCYGYPIFQWQSFAVCPEIKGTFCGNELATMNDQLMINATPSATNYEFEAFDGTYTLTWTKNSGLLGFKMSNFVGVKYNTTYQVKVRAFVGSWQSWGAACSITTPETKVRDNFCATTLTTMEDQLMIYPTKDATNYQFEANDGTNTLTWTKGSGLLGFKMSNFPGIKVNTTYQVKVRAYIAGAWQGFGVVCQITTPNKHIRGCGVSNMVTLDEQLLIYGQEGATNYEYEAFDGLNTLTWVKGSDLLGFKMGKFVGVLMNTSYQVKVRAYVSGSWQSWGDACTFTTHAPKEGNFASNETIEEATEQKFELSIYPNPNNGTFTISSTTEGVFQISNELGQLIQNVEITTENNFSTKIDALSMGVYFVKGTVNNEVITKKVVIQ